MMCDDGYTLVINFMSLSTKLWCIQMYVWDEVFKLHVAMLEDQPISIYLNNNNNLNNNNKIINK